MNKIVVSASTVLVVQCGITLHASNNEGTNTTNTTKQRWKSEMHDSHCIIPTQINRCEWIKNGCFRCRTDLHQSLKHFKGAKVHKLHFSTEVLTTKNNADHHTHLHAIRITLVHTTAAKNKHGHLKKNYKCKWV